MAIERSTVIVIRKVDFKDSDYVVTLFGRNSGKFAGIAKGARKLDSKFGGVFDLLNLVEVVYYQGSGLDFVSEAELIENWDEMRKSSEAIDTGLRCARIINKLLEDGQKERRAYDLLKETLVSLNESRARPRVVELSFYLNLFSFLGYQPRLNKCISCGKLVEGEDKVRFSPEVGGVICSDCSSEQGFPISAGLRKVLVKLSGSSPNEVSGLKVPPSQLHEGFSLLNRFGQFQFDQELIYRTGSNAGS
ncbi:MAG: DNA repair protein RecO [Candidatus Bipolaricaulia bacterium]